MSPHRAGCKIRQPDLVVLMQKQVSSKDNLPRAIIETDNIFTVDRDVISNATGRRHGNPAGCTIGANYSPSPPIDACAVLHQRALAKGVR
jgi:hypothetical protein